MRSSLEFCGDKCKSTQRQIVIVRNYQSELNRSITSARVLIINKSLDCLITDPKKKIELQKLRNFVAAEIITTGANLRFSGSAEVQISPNFAKKLATKIIKRNILNKRITPI